MGGKKKQSSRRDTEMMESQSSSKKLKGVRGETTIPYFPFDIIVNILARLPVKVLARFQTVCKLWYCIIFHPCFVGLHLRRTKDQRPGYLMKANNRLLRSYNQRNRPVYFLQNKEEAAMKDNMVEVFQPSDMAANNYSIVDSCHGLVCFSDYYRTVCIYNPTTQKLIYLPKTSTRSYEMAFGFDPLSREYKVFRIFPNDTATSMHEVSGYEVFTLGSDSWRQKGFLPYYPSETKHLDCLGAFHWMFGHKKNPHMLLSLHINEEIARIIPIPHAKDGSCSPFLIQYEGKLAICMMGAEEMTIWVLTRSTKLSWEKRHIVIMPSWMTRGSVPTKIPPTLVRRDCDLIISRGRTKLVFYNLKTQMSKNINTSHLGGWSDIRILEHMETLVNPCGLACSKMRWPEIMKYVEYSFAQDYNDGKASGIISTLGAATLVLPGLDLHQLLL